VATLHEDQYAFFIISRSVILRMRNVSDQSRRENQNTRFISITFFFRKSCSLRDNVEKYCRAGQATGDNTTHAHCMLIPKATNTHSKYVIVIVFPLQQCLHELPQCYFIGTMPVLLVMFISKEICFLPTMNKRII